MYSVPLVCRLIALSLSFASVIASPTSNLDVRHDGVIKPKVFLIDMVKFWVKAGPVPLKSLSSTAVPTRGRSMVQYPRIQPLRKKHHRARILPSLP